MLNRLICTEYLECRNKTKRATLYSLTYGVELLFLHKLYKGLQQFFKENLTKNQFPCIDFEYVWVFLVYLKFGKTKYEVS